MAQLGRLQVYHALLNKVDPKTGMVLQRILTRMAEVDSRSSAGLYNGGEDENDRPPTGDDYNDLWDAILDEINAELPKQKPKAPQISVDQLEHGKLYRAVSKLTGARILGACEIIYCRQGIGCFLKGDDQVPVLVEYNDQADLTDSDPVTRDGHNIYLDDQWREVRETDLAFIEIDEDGND